MLPSFFVWIEQEPQVYELLSWDLPGMKSRRAVVRAAPTCVRGSHRRQTRGPWFFRP
jgi:hypothetical protein